MTRVEDELLQATKRPGPTATVTRAKAGAQAKHMKLAWVPAFAAMTEWKGQKSRRSFVAAVLTSNRRPLFGNRCAKKFGAK